MASIIPRFKAEQSFTVPTTSGNYAPERLSFGPPPANVLEEALEGICALLEATQVASAVLELWLPKTGATGVDADYTYSGYSVSSGALIVPLFGALGAQLRVKSGGTSGTQVVTASAI